MGAGRITRCKDTKKIGIVKKTLIQMDFCGFIIFLYLCKLEYIKTTNTMKSNFMKHAATYGLYIGLALIILTLVDYLMGFYGQNQLFNLIQYAVMIGGIAWATIQYRNKEMGGFISYGQSVSYGVMMSVCFGLVSVVFTILLMTVIDPGYMGKVMEITSEKLLEQGAMSEAQIEQMMEMSAKMGPFTLITTFIGGIIGLVVAGLIISLITSIFTKKAAPFTPAV